ncbi:MAG: hypothetical protein JWL90_4629 [Chthoniobacteraceae bacterium]|nr:hypothetical protein [Chthoniobacteraceae bacterium]
MMHILRFQNLQGLLHDVFRLPHDVLVLLHEYRLRCEQGAMRDFYEKGGRVKIKPSLPKMR